MREGCTLNGENCSSERIQVDWRSHTCDSHWDWDQGNCRIYWYNALIISDNREPLTCDGCHFASNLSFSGLNSGAVNVWELDGVNFSTKRTSCNSQGIANVCKSSNQRRRDFIVVIAIKWVADSFKAIDVSNNLWPIFNCVKEFIGNWLVKDSCRVIRNPCTLIKLDI